MSHSKNIVQLICFWAFLGIILIFCINFCPLGSNMIDLFGKFLEVLWKDNYFDFFLKKEPRLWDIHKPHGQWGGFSQMTILLHKPHIIKVTMRREGVKTHRIWPRGLWMSFFRKMGRTLETLYIKEYVFFAFFSNLSASEFQN